MRKVALISSTTMLMAGVLLAGSWSQAAERLPELQPGAQAPNFTLTDAVSGKKVSLSDYSGKIVVLEWTNPQCPFVQRHYKEGTMTGLADKYKEKGVVWLAIDSNSSETADDNRKFAQENHLPYPVLDDSASSVAKSYRARSTPDMFIIDKEGKLAYQGAIDNDPDGEKGAARVNYVDQALTELLAGKSVSTPETKSYGCGVHYAS